MTRRTWWDAFADAGGMPDLETWLGGVDAASRLAIRRRIAECHYESVLDCGAGLGLDWIGMTNLSHHVSYTGIEPSESMRNGAIAQARRYERYQDPPIVDGGIEDIPFPDSNFDLVYARHIFEHLPRFHIALSEMIRVARLEAIVVFFMRPGRETYLFREQDGLWQNRYAKEEIETELVANPKAEVWFWETLGGEVLLHIYLQETLDVDVDKVAARVVPSQVTAAPADE